MDINENVEQLIKTSFVQLSKPQACNTCDNYVRLVGEQKANGNWYCPSCGAWIPYSTADSFEITTWKRAQRLTDLSILFPTNGLTGN